MLATFRRTTTSTACDAEPDATVMFVLPSPCEVMRPAVDTVATPVFPVLNESDGLLMTFPAASFACTLSCTVIPREKSVSITPGDNASVATTGGSVPPFPPPPQAATTNAEITTTCDSRMGPRGQCQAAPDVKSSSRYLDRECTPRVDRGERF